MPQMTRPLPASAPRSAWETRLTLGIDGMECLNQGGVGHAVFFLLGISIKGCVTKHDSCLTKSKLFAQIRKNATLGSHVPNGILSYVFCEFYVSNGTLRRKRWTVGGKIDNQKPGELDSPGWDILEVLMIAKSCRALWRFRAKWTSVRARKTRQNKRADYHSDSIRTDRL